MHPDQGRHRMLGTGAVRPVENAGDFQPVKAFKTHDFRIHHFRFGDGRVERIGQLGMSLALQVHDMEVGG